MQNELITQGLTLMALGMGVVFVFLALLVVTTSVMSTILGRYFPQAIPVKSAELPSSASGPVPDARILAIIREAIRKHRES